MEVAECVGLNTRDEADWQVIINLNAGENVCKLRITRKGIDTSHGICVNEETENVPGSRAKVSVPSGRTTSPNQSRFASQDIMAKSQNRLSCSMHQRSYFRASQSTLSHYSFSSSSSLRAEGNCKWFKQLANEHIDST